MRNIEKLPEVNRVFWLPNNCSYFVMVPDKGFTYGIGPRLYMHEGWPVLPPLHLLPSFWRSLRSSKWIYPTRQQIIGCEVDHGFDPARVFEVIGKYVQEVRNETD